LSSLAVDGIGERHLADTQPKRGFLEGKKKKATGPILRIGSGLSEICYVMLRRSAK